MKLNEKGTTMKLNEKLVTELRATLIEVDDPLAVVVFVISETDDDTESQVKVIANIPTGAAAEVQQLINGAMDEVVAYRIDKPEEELYFDDKVALTLCDTFADGLSGRQQALWHFHEDAIDLCDAFVDAKLCRKELHDWYKPFRSFLNSQPFDVTPALIRLADRGRTTGSLASLWTVAVCSMVPIDHRDPPAEISEGIEEMATHHIARFFETIRDKAAVH